MRLLLYLLLLMPDVLTLDLILSIRVSLISGPAFASPPPVPFQLRPLAHLQEIPVQLLDVVLTEAFEDERFEASGGPAVSRNSNHPHDAVDVPLVCVADENVADGERLLAIELVLLQLGRR